jgi:hypothetical protein
LGCGGWHFALYQQIASGKPLLSLSIKEKQESSGEVSSLLFLLLRFPQRVATPWLISEQLHLHSIRDPQGNRTVFIYTNGIRGALRDRMGGGVGFTASSPGWTSRLRRFGL